MVNRNTILKIFILILAVQANAVIRAQDTERPLPPVLDLITVAPSSGHTTLSWSPGGSPDVAGYVIYLYSGGEGIAFDTIFNPVANSYTDMRSNPLYFSVSYVIAAIDSSGNTSPLSNVLTTIFLESELDTCNNMIRLVWNRYNTGIQQVDAYGISYSVNGSLFSEAGTVPFSDTTFSMGEIEAGSDYCFIVNARLTSSDSSGSNRSCVYTGIARPPEWINADYSRVSENGVELSFSYDPLSGISRFIIERSGSPEGNFTAIGNINDDDGNFIYTDQPAGGNVYYYRAGAVNSCANIVKYSNITTMVRTLAISDGDNIGIRWDRYHEYEGEVLRYRLFRNNGNIFGEIASVQPADTLFVDPLRDFAYESTTDSVCYFVEVEETGNTHVPGMVSRSATSCAMPPAQVYVPNAFTPDGDGRNDTFRPVFPFTPSFYHLIIKSKSGITLFETASYLDEWNGIYRGNVLRSDVYLWFLEAETPGGRSIRKSGTVTILL